MGLQLTDNFNSDEFGLNLTDQDLQNYFLLCRFVLEPVRARWGVVNITSGKRTADKNLSVSGVKDSQHLLGEACDFVCPYAASAPNGMGSVYYYIINELAWRGETIWYKRRGHCHVSLPRYNVHADFYINEKD